MSRFARNLFSIAFIVLATSIAQTSSAQDIVLVRISKEVGRPVMVDFYHSTWSTQQRRWIRGNKIDSIPTVKNSPLNDYVIRRRAYSFPVWAEFEFTNKRGERKSYNRTIHAGQGTYFIVPN